MCADLDLQSWFCLIIWRTSYGKRKIFSSFSMLLLPSRTFSFSLSLSTLLAQGKSGVNGHGSATMLEIFYTENKDRCVYMRREKKRKENIYEEKKLKKKTKTLTTNILSIVYQSKSTDENFIVSISILTNEIELHWRSCNE